MRVRCPSRFCDLALNLIELTASVCVRVLPYDIAEESDHSPLEPAQTPLNVRGKIFFLLIFVRLGDYGQQAQQSPYECLGVVPIGFHTLSSYDNVLSMTLPCDSIIGRAQTSTILMSWDAASITACTQGGLIRLATLDSTSRVILVPPTMYGTASFSCIGEPESRDPQLEQALSAEM